MDSPQVFTQVLTNIGIAPPRNRAAIVTHGFDTFTQLGRCTKAALDELFDTIQSNNRHLDRPDQRVNMSMSMKTKLHAIRSELSMRKECNAPIDENGLLALTVEKINILSDKHLAWNESKKANTSQSLPDIVVPKLSKNNWKEFQTAIYELLSRHRGVYGVPLTYVIRKNVLGNYEDDFDSTEAQLHDCIELRGSMFTQDKRTVYSLLVENCKTSEAETMVEQYKLSRDGRKAWLAILSHMQSTSYMDNLKSNAMKAIKDAHYIGERREFGISKFFTVHSNAHNDLATADEPLSDGMKITHFMQGMKEATAITYAISTKAENPQATFEEFYNSFSAKLTAHITLTTSTERSVRTVNQLHTDNDTESQSSSTQSRN